VEYTLVTTFGESSANTLLTLTRIETKSPFGALDERRVNHVITQSHRESRSVFWRRKSPTGFQRQCLQQEQFSLIPFFFLSRILAIDTLQWFLPAHPALLKGIDYMATNFATMTNPAPRFPVALTFSSPSAANRKSTTKSKKLSARPGKMIPFDPQALLIRIAAGKSVSDYQAEDSIFSQGDPADAVFYIQTGMVKLAVVSASGKEAVIAYLPEKSFFGEGSIAGQQLRISTASALQSCTIVRIEKTIMLGLLFREPEFSGQFLAHMLSRNLRMEADLVDHLFNSSEKRLARLLLMMANFGQDSKPVPAIAKISQETLAEMIGTTRSRVSFFLNRFRDLGFINYNSSGMNVNSSLACVVAHD